MSIKQETKNFIMAKWASNGLTAEQVEKEISSGNSLVKESYINLAYGIIPAMSFSVPAIAGAGLYHLLNMNVNRDDARAIRKKVFDDKIKELKKDTERRLSNV